MTLFVFNEVFNLEFISCEGILDIKSHDALYICISVFFENEGVGFF